MAKTGIRNTLLAAAFVAGGASVAFAGGGYGKSQAAQITPDMTVVEAAIASPDHTTLVAAVKAAGLVETLSAPGPYTVFAPTDAAFAALPAGTVEGLLEPEAKEALTKILACHVLATEAMSGAIVDMISNGGGSATISTLGGCNFTAMIDGGNVVVMDGQGNKATVTAVDLDQSNGVIHVLDGVLLPSPQDMPSAS